jgi:hypothetical protein
MKQTPGLSKVLPVGSCDLISLAEATTESASEAISIPV